ncbi:FIST C-terminal domain-containing protein [Streptomyces sp. NBC_00841]|uniref:FIST signal transduction protein n=1 Tax=unclassified Streptomyces TaxID=2593676 RepID=UPI00224EF03D|nr:MULTISPECIES: FIST N-terminal domain-containing protein [unclassified Streptomyces]MCX4530894.1 FIST C-terminal domain-containing protein [Streptomyces sp. NBC_01669]WSA03360.1 FIST C-terminal domain-containing protein [Streptomyces sp. NBC_00841]
MTFSPPPASGVVRAHATGPAAQAMSRLLADIDQGLAGRAVTALLYFASSAYDPEVLAPAFSARFPGTTVIGCSTAGEFTDLRNGTGGIAAVALPDDVIARAAAVIGRIGEAPGEGTAAAVRTLEERIGVQLRHLDPAYHLGFLLVDGLHGAEEQVNDMLGNAAPLLDFVGGSAGDDFALHATWVAVGTEVSHDGMAMMVCRSAVPFQIVKTCSFTPTGTVLRVTGADAASRTVHRFDGRPAAQAYADAVGVAVEALDVDVFMERPVGQMIDGQPWIRTPQAVTPGGGLRFWAQILPGTEVEVMRPGNLLADTRATLRQARLDLGGASGAVLFNCGFRRLEMDAKNISATFPTALDGIPSAGFHTYGESWLGHVNQTLTGVVFGVGAS